MGKHDAPGKPDTKPSTGGGKHEKPVQIPKQPKK